MSPAANPTSLAAVRLRQATLADLEAILALERITENAPHWPLSTYAAILEPQNISRPLRCLFIAEQHNAIVGFAAALIHDAETPADLETVAVAASARRAGIGRVLCTAALDWCRERGAASALLEVRATSAAAIALYTALGFVLESRRPRYYSDPEDDALILRLTWSNPA